MNSVDFYLTAFQAALGTGALLFGVFGFLFTIYASYFQDDEKIFKLPKVVPRLRQLCRLLAGLICGNALVILYAFWLLAASGLAGHALVLGGLISLVGVATAALSVYMASPKMMP